MIKRDGNAIGIKHPDGAWEAVHDVGTFGGPQLLRFAGAPLFEQLPFHVDDFSSETAIPGKLRAFRKGGAAVVYSSGRFPFGEEVSFQQTCRYASNHVRIALDLRWRRSTSVRRHLGLGGVLLPGSWRRFFCVPPSSHLAAGKRPQWHAIPSDPAELPLMIGHWHRPPLALVFERSDGVQFEVGTGSDLWRWEYCLGYGPENGSYKVMLEQDGLRVIREPLMCCEAFFPEARDYRFTWYLAWRAPGEALGEVVPPARMRLSADGQTLVTADDSGGTGGRPLAAELDFRLLARQEDWCRSLSPTAHIQGERSGEACWQCGAFHNAARRIVRQLAGLGQVDCVTVMGVTPGICWCPAHLGKRHPEGLAHWDVNAILDFSVWARQQLGRTCRIRALPDDLLPLPSVGGLFGQNGFDVRQDGSVDG